MRELLQIFGRATLEIFHCVVACTLFFVFDFLFNFFDLKFSHHIFRMLPFDKTCEFCCYVLRVVVLSLSLFVKNWNL